MRKYTKDLINKLGTCFIIKTAKLEGNKFVENTYIEGNAQVLPNIIPVTINHYFDIASLTKTFTAICIFKTKELGLINLDDKISDIDDRFLYLQSITIRDLLCHRVELWTNGYLGDAKNKDEFCQMLFESKIKEYHRKYIDSHFIILSMVLERIHQKTYSEIVDEIIIKPLNLKHTTFDCKSDEVVSNNYSKQKNGEAHTDILPGIPHDTKARIAKKLNMTVGHAGIFTTADDLFKVLFSFINNENALLKDDTIKEMLEHDDIYDDVSQAIHNYAKQKKIKLKETENLNELYECINDENLIDIIPKPYNYMSARYKHFLKYKNNLSELANSKTITFSGYTGPIYIIDFERKIIILIMTNVCHNSKLEYKKRLNMSYELINNIYKDLIGGEND